MELSIFLELNQYINELKDILICETQNELRFPESTINQKLKKITIFIYKSQ